MSQVSRVKPAGWLALAVLVVLGVSLLGLAGRALFGGRRQPVVRPPTPTAAPVAATTAPTAAPEPEAAWTTFRAAVNACDSLPDQGDDLALYPSDLEALRATAPQLTTDQAWLARCDDGYNHYTRLLVTYGPRNLDCTGDRCTAAVAVTSTGALTYYAPFCAAQPERCQTGAAQYPHYYAQWQQQGVALIRPPSFAVPDPFRLVQAVLSFQEGTWFVTQMIVTELPATPAAATPQP